MLRKALPGRAVEMGCDFVHCTPGGEARRGA